MPFGDLRDFIVQREASGQLPRGARAASFEQVQENLGLRERDLLVEFATPTKAFENSSGSMFDGECATIEPVVRSNASARGYMFGAVLSPSRHSGV